jgi:hypothetical protein
MDTDGHRWEAGFPWHERLAHVCRLKITKTTEGKKSTEKKGGANGPLVFNWYFPGFPLCGLCGLCDFEDRVQN